VPPASIPMPAPPRRAWEAKEYPDFSPPETDSGSGAVDRLRKQAGTIKSSHGDDTLTKAKKNMDPLWTIAVVAGERV
jgi:hypothetical protein